MLRLALGGAAACVAAASDASPAPIDRAGPYAVRDTPSRICCDRKGRRIDVYRPLGADRPPVVTWGIGTWARPSQYAYAFRYLASWGIAVIATHDNNAASGETMGDAVARVREALDDELDFDRIAAVGHSQGATGAINAAARDPAHVRVVVAIDLPAPRFCRKHECDDLAARLPYTTSVLFLSGERDPLSTGRDVSAYFMTVRSRLKAMAMLRDGDHNDIQGQPSCAFAAIGCRRGATLALFWTARWLRWQLKIDGATGEAFVGSASRYSRDEELITAKVMIANPR